LFFLAQTLHLLKRTQILHGKSKNGVIINEFI
jgi:hypothetical protein